MKPFRDEYTSSAFRNIEEKITSEIRSLDNEYVLNSSPVELEKYYVDQILIEPITLYSDQQYIKNQSTTQVRIRHRYEDEDRFVKGTKIQIAIPFEGDSTLWKLQPSSFTYASYPEINIKNNEVIFDIEFADHSANSKELKSEIEESTKALSGAIKNLRNDVERHNNSSPRSIRQALSSKLELAKTTVGAIASLGIPIQRSNSKPIYTIPTKRKSRPVQKPSASLNIYSPEPTLDEKEYQYILEILKSMSLVIERNPFSFASLDEEAIRDHFLLQLNGHYEGSATGETFNASGKTDILIREGNKNVFIAECKFWHGQKAFKDAVDQLLGYLTWRDSKTALLVFNKTKDTTAIREKMNIAMQEITEYRKTVFHDPSGESRYILVKNDDPGKEIIVTTQLYDIPEKN